jgi:hypothetical protein
MVVVVIAQVVTQILPVAVPQQVGVEILNVFT